MRVSREDLADVAGSRRHLLARGRRPPPPMPLAVWLEVDAFDLPELVDVARVPGVDPDGMPRWPHPGPRPPA